MLEIERVLYVQKFAGQIISHITYKLTAIVILLNCLMLGRSVMQVKHKMALGYVIIYRFIKRDSSLECLSRSVSLVLNGPKTLGLRRFDQ